MSVPSQSGRGSTSLFARRPQRDPATQVGGFTAREHRGRPDRCTPPGERFSGTIDRDLDMASARSTPVGRATCGCLPGAASPIVDGIGIGWASTSRERWRLNQRDPPRARNEDLLTERPTLAIPRLCHNA